ncbi:MAG: DUF3309 family protein [Chloroflexi bacterium]|nr:DUF3309 family protein [Chloroflexota bacterium]
MRVLFLVTTIPNGVGFSRSLGYCPNGIAHEPYN